jgi:shikimate dehydrogenase
MKPSPTPYALLGHPVGHSLSPAMHNAAFRALGLNARYTLLDVLPRDLPATLDELHAGGFGGLNITIPHKEAAFRFLARHHAVSDSAQVLRAVNTVVFRRDGAMEGHNTDAPDSSTPCGRPSAPRQAASASCCWARAAPAAPSP